MRKEIIGDATLYLGDCMEIMKDMPDKSVDAVVTDPPYGIKASDMNLGFSASSRIDKSSWDESVPPKSCFDRMLMISKLQILWGGNYFANLLPNSKGWLVWNKGGSFKDRSFSECELAWASIDRNTAEITYNPLSMGAYINRCHKTQKPTAIMKWCLAHIPNAQTILDPFMGSGTTGVACMELGRKFIGIEIDEKYFDIACKRIDMAERQGKLF